MSGSDDPKEKTPGTLSGDDVKDEFRKFKEKLLGAPAAVSGLAKVAADAGSKLADDIQVAGEKVQAAAKTPDAVLAKLEVMEGRLDSMEGMLREILERLGQLPPKEE